MVVAGVPVTLATLAFADQFAESGPGAKVAEMTNARLAQIDARYRLVRPAA